MQAQNGLSISRYREQGKRTEYIEGETTFDQKVVGADLGYFFSGTVA